jgi:hypothetical protein
MRATYLASHIDRGDSMQRLMRISGVRSLDALPRYVKFVA